MFWEANTRHGHHCIDMGIPGVVTTNSFHPIIHISHDVFSTLCLRIARNPSYYQSEQSRIKASTFVIPFSSRPSKAKPTPLLHLSNSTSLARSPPNPTSYHITIKTGSDPKSPETPSHPIHPTSQQSTSHSNNLHPPRDLQQWPQQRTTTTSTSP